MAVWFITGATRGLGREIAAAALCAGDRVVATGRDADAVRAALPGAPERLLALPLDVTDEAAALAAVAGAVERFGRIDILVNNAGRGLIGAIEETTARETRDLFDTNVFGLLNVTRAVLPTMRAQRAGRIINIGSVGGFAAAVGSGAYAATKFAVEGITEALNNDLAELGVRATVVEPGAFRTDFLDASSMHFAAGTIEDYAATSGARRSSTPASNHTQAGDPAKAAAAIVELARAAAPPVRLPLGPDSVARVEGKLTGVAEELARWRSVALSTDHDDVPTH